MFEPVLQANMQKHHPKFQHSICIQCEKELGAETWAQSKALDIFHKSGLFLI
jgi:hypothetical protein